MKINNKHSSSRISQIQFNKLYRQIEILLSLRREDRPKFNDVIKSVKDNYQNIMELNETIKENRENGLKSLVIMDDVQRALKDNNVIKVFKEMVANQRHLNVSFIILLQNYFALDNKVRELIHNVIFFKMDKKQNKKIFEECAEMPQSVFNELNDYIFDAPYNWCLINQRNKKIYKMWDEVEINNDDED
jgi:hypothetical protein